MSRAGTSEKKPERAIIHRLHTNGKWAKSSTEVLIEPQSFAEGAFRKAFKCKLKWENKWQIFVTKFAKDKNTPRSLYYKDIEAQVCAMVWAKKYNACNPPKDVQFALCFVLELVDRPGRPVCGAEVFISGKFMKHNNNVGAVCTGGPSSPEIEMDRKTAQAFSHFTYDASRGQFLICDIQGVNGIYTDPQIHTVNGKGFGSGNLGQTGIRAFLLRHTCNEVCKAAGLEPIRAKELGSGKVADRKHSGFNFTTLNDRVREKSPARPAANYIRPKSSLPMEPNVKRGSSTDPKLGEVGGIISGLDSSHKCPVTQKRSPSQQNRPPRLEVTQSQARPSNDKNRTVYRSPKSIMDEADEKLMNSIMNGLSL